MIQMIPLKNLALSQHNVRKNDVLLDLESLAASILARGLLQNLIGAATPRKKKKYDIMAGGRRLRALWHLLDKGDVTGDYPVPVEVLDGNSAHHSEISLAENFHRLAMTPADECTAFKHFIGELGDIDAVAIRFGVTRRHIEGRLRLATLAEPIFAALADGKITLDTAKAYGATNDTTKQLAVFEEFGKSWQSNNAMGIRNAILTRSITAGDAVAQFVGLAAYEAAGGRSARELFDAEDKIRWIDPEIAHTIAHTRLAELADIVREGRGLAWVKTCLTPRVSYEESSALYEVCGEQAELSEADLARVAVIEAEQNEIADRLENGDGTEGELLSAKYEALDAELSAFEQRASIVSDEIRAQVGQFIILTSEGVTQLDPRYFSTTPIDGIHSQSAPNAKFTNAATVAAKAQGLSGKLLDELAVQRRDLLAVHVASDPGFALDLAIFMLAEKSSGAHSSGSCNSTLQAIRPQDPVSASTLTSTNAQIHLSEIGEALDRSWCSFISVAERFDAFRALDDGARAAWLAYNVAKSLEATTGVTGTQHYSAFHNHLGTVLEIDTASWWRPTAANYFGRVNKTKMVSVLDEIGGPTLAARYSAAKRGELAVACEMLCSGTAQVEPEVRERALAWIPSVMRFDGASADGTEGDIEDNTDHDGEDGAQFEQADEDALPTDEVVNASTEEAERVEAELVEV